MTRTGADLWAQLGIVATSVNEVAIDPNDPTHVYCSIYNSWDPAQNAVFESTDNGESWTPISVNNNFNGSASWLGVNPATSIPWAIHDTKKLFRYDPQAGTWMDTNVCPTSSTPLISELDFDPAGAAYRWVAPAAPTPISSGSRPTTGRPGRRWGLSARPARAAARSR